MDKIEKKLRAAIESALDSGGCVADTIPAIGTVWSSCCLMGAVALSAGYLTDKKYREVAADRLGLSVGDTMAIETGFMCLESFRDENPTRWDLGNRLRKIYCDDNGETE